MEDSTAPRKPCRTCGLSKPATPEFFYRHSTCTYGVSNECKGCRQARMANLRPPPYHLSEAYRAAISAPETYTDDPAVRRVPIGGRGTQPGTYALVDEAIFDFLMRWNWTSGRSGYALRSAGSGRYLFMAHVVIGDTEGLCVDHINGIRLDNRRANLRLATYGQNNANKQLDARKSKTGFRGVYRNTRGKPFSAQMRADGVTHYLGSYESPEEAARAYDAAALKRWGEFSTLNFPAG